MTGIIVAVHPAVVIFEAEGKKIEIPVSWFPASPKPGQTWELNLLHQPTDRDRVATLNEYLHD